MEAKSIKKNVVYNIIKTVSAIIFPLITFPYVSRVLLPDNIGKVSFANTIVGYFALIASLGVTVYAIRECATVRENKQELSRVASQIFTINLYTTIFSYLLLAIFLIFLHPFEKYKTLIIIQSTVILFTTLGADWLNSAMEDFGYITLRTFIFQVISLVALFLFVRKQSDYIIYAIITTVSAGGANILNIFYRRRFCKVGFISNVEWKRHFPPILSLFVMQLAQIVFCSADITMLGLIHSDYEVGLYTAAVKIYNIVNQVMASILLVVMPRLSSAFAQKNYSAINELLRKIFGFLMALGLPCTVGVVMLSKEIMQIVGGEEYISAAPVLQILMLALFFSLFGGTFIGNIILLPSKKEKPYLKVCCITAVVNVVLNAVLIPFFGIYGAAATTAFSTLFILLLLLPKVEKEINIGKIWKLILLPVIGCIFIALIALAMRLLVAKYLIRTVLTVILSVTVYGLILIIGKYELANNIVQAFFNKLKHILKAG